MELVSADKGSSLMQTETASHATRLAEHVRQSWSMDVLLVSSERPSRIPASASVQILLSSMPTVYADPVSSPVEHATQQQRTTA